MRIDTEHYQGFLVDARKHTLEQAEQVIKERFGEDIVYSLYHEMSANHFWFRVYYRFNKQTGFFEYPHDNNQWGEEEIQYS